MVGDGGRCVCVACGVGPRRRVLLRHANSVKMVRLYAKFLEHVRQDSLLAAKWFA